MRALLRITAYTALTFLAALLLIAAWWLLSKRGLPDVDALKTYTPAQEVLLAPQSCLNQTHAIPSDDLRTIIPLLDSTEDQLTNQIARTILCNGETQINRNLREIRLALQMRVRFNTRALETIYLNRVYLGDNQWGIEDAAQHYFAMHASALTLPQAALLVGLIRSPQRDSPYKHPDRALARRNAILQSYALLHKSDDAAVAAAIAEPLGIK